MSYILITLFFFFKSKSFETDERVEVNRSNYKWYVLLRYDLLLIL